VTEHVPEDGKLLKIVWAAGELEFDDPVLDPLLVGTIAEPGDDGVLPTLRAMTVTLDIDALPRLREAFERTSHGEGLDVISQWHTSASPDPTDPPLAFLYVELPELDLRFRVRFVVDEFRRSLAAAARTGEVMFQSPELNRATRIDRPDEAFRRYPSMTLSVPNVEPLRVILRQRFDLPFPEVSGQPRRVIEPGQGGIEVDRFVHGASKARDLAVYIPPDDFTTFVVVDPEVAGAMERAIADDNRWAHWASMLTGPYAMARLDVLAGETRLAAWLFPEPSPELVRAASAGPHRIVVVTDDVALDALTQDVLRGAIEFRVEQAPDSMRNLLRWAADKDARETSDVKAKSDEDDDSTGSQSA
jgi:hypothetical protein